MAKRIQSAGYGSSNDAYHNSFLDTGSILANALKNKIGGKLPLPKESQDQEEVVKGESSVIDSVGKEFTAKAVELLDSLRDDLIYYFQEVSSDKVASSRIESMIRKSEEIGYALGVEMTPFDPLRNMSGLKSGDVLENAEKVITNTVSHYKLFSVTSAKAFNTNKGPAIEINIIGEQGDCGFEINGKVVSNNDFNGNEAIDYVYSPDGGLMTVKARHQGAWVDVSEDFIVDCQIKRYKLSENKQGEHSAFLGEKIISDGKEKIVKALKLNNDDLRFGKCRVFSEKREIVDLIRNLVRVNQK